ncbi:MAG: phenylalanine--tRNA ligase subunit beta [Desulfuromonas sp.]|nr:MAG: phenylalanine--tRNA ligase subunit beta [Desulfuromonas sp.]
MIVTYNWLKEYVDFSLTPDELSHRLTMAGLEVDFMEKQGEGLDSVIVARLQSVEPHPEADRLTLCQVDTGNGVVQIVCGARNHRTGDLVALAQVGSVLPGNFKIKKSKIRGVVSLGMLCSEKELGLAEESEGILILPADLELGTPVFAALGLKDVHYELGLTPNRADCLSVIGVAREVAGMANAPLRLPEPVVTEAGAPIESLTSITIDEPELCPRYTARLITGVKIGPSPRWLVERLEAIGLRSINNVVDVTNYVLMELGHPLHAFDFNLLRGKKIVVRRAQDGDVFTTLDSQERQLNSTDLTICDGEGAVALAGIMGGENSEIQPETTDVLLESAYFDPLTIRRTSKRLGIHTDSSHRFERGADVDIVTLALDRATALIHELAGGEVAKGRIDVYPASLPQRQVTLRPKRCAEILGLDLPESRIDELLRGISLPVKKVTQDGEGLLQVTIPRYRHDLEREIDLVEEVARLNGYDAIPVTMPVSQALCQRAPKQQRQVRQLRDTVVAAGFSEVVNYSFIAMSSWDRLALAADDVRRKTVKVLNPLTEEQAVMRTTLLPSLLETVARNLAYRSRDLRLFELRPVFLPQEGEELPVEKLRLTAALCGRRDPDGWAQSREMVDFFDAKGMVEAILSSFLVEKVNWSIEVDEPYLHPGKSALLKTRKRVIGTVGELHPQVQANFEIDAPLYLIDLDLEALFAESKEFGGFRPLSRFPDVYRDTALLVDEGVSAAHIFSVFEKSRSREVEEMILFDLYRGDKLPEGKKSLAIRVRYRSPEKTLTDDEISRFHGRIVDALCKQLQAEVR